MYKCYGRGRVIFQLLRATDSDGCCATSGDSVCLPPRSKWVTKFDKVLLMLMLMNSASYLAQDWHREACVSHQCRNMSDVECWPFVRLAQGRVAQEKQIMVAKLPSQHVFMSLRRKEAEQHTEAKLFEMQLK